ncbi:GntR family transcriptional regulator, partial [Nonomuraea sp. RK-328]|nr:GntR family transcriptional regulator [Nonomuraea sp. RK-328]
LAKCVDKRQRHQQIAAELRAQIMSSVFKAGEKLPSTSLLVEQYRTVNATVSKAMGLLKDEGLVRGEAGKGVFVRSKQPFIVSATAYKEPSPRGYSYQLLNVAEVVPPGEVLDALNLGEGGRAVVRQRLLLHDGDPVELSWSYYPVDIAAGTPLAGKGKIRGGAPAVLEELGLPELSFKDRISARQPRTEEVELLCLPLDVPVIRQFRVVRSRGERPVEVSILIKGGHLYELEYEQAIPEIDC